MVATAVLLAALPPSSATNASARSSSVAAPPAAASASAAGLSGQDYWQRVQQYEPWALQERGGSGAVAGTQMETADGGKGQDDGEALLRGRSILDHMRAPGSV
jgi:hypothetical protein